MATVNIPKACQLCPSYLKPEDTPSKFKKSIGTPMCGRYGYVLGRPGMDERAADKLGKHFAEKCDAYGQPLPPIPVTKKFEVALPDPEARDTSTIDKTRQAMVRSCASCKNFISEQAVASELGWTAGLCAAKGRIIMTNQQVYEARDCEYREFGQHRTSTAGINLFPEYEDAFNLNVDVTRAYFKSRENFVEPHDYPTDKPVTEDEAESGIRAWRRIADPEGSGNEVFLPIYRLDFFDEDERAKIPKTDDDEHPEMYVDHFGGVYLAAVTWTELDETPALWGEAGTGKTELFRHLAWLMCLPFVRINITGQTELDDLAGKMRFDPDKGTYFQYGRLPLAWQKPCVMVIDEPTVGPPDVWQFIRPLTDNSKQMALDMNKGEILPRHDDCYMGMAMNPAWDPKNVGSMQIGDADASRLFHVWVELPPAVLEREIIQNRVKLDGWELSKEQMDFLMNVAGEVRDLCKEGTLPITWAIRPQIKVARALRWFDPVTAYRRAVGDYLEPEAQAALLDVVRAHMQS